jgi:hypothetical protein
MRSPLLSVYELRHGFSSDISELAHSCLAWHLFRLCAKAIEAFKASDLKVIL